MAPSDSGHPSWSSPTRWCAAGALLAALLGVGAFLLLPGYASVSVIAEGTGSPGPAEVTARHAMDINGARVLLVGLVPIVIAAGPIAVPRRQLRSTVAVSATLLTLFSFIGGASMGLFVLPAAVLEWVAFALSFRRTR